MRAQLATTLVAALVLAVAASALGACNTTAGLGQDLSAAGRAVTNKADQVKQGM